MTQYDELKLFIKAHPGTTRRMMRRFLPKITHENELLKKLVESGEGYRERIKDENGREVWGYFLC